MPTKIRSVAPPLLGWARDLYLSPRAFWVGLERVIYTNHFYEDPPTLAETVAGAVLLTPNHVSHFSDFLVPNLSELSQPFDELIVVASGLNRKSILKVESSLANLPVSWHRRLIKFPLGGVGTNRNRGLAESKSDLVTFLDSDDFFHPDYAKFILGAYANNPFHILLHTCSFFDPTTSAAPEFSPMGDVQQVGYLSSKDFVERPDIDWELNPESFGDTNLSQADQTRAFPFAQGHVTVLRGFPLRFHENPQARNEDGVFLNQALLRGAKINAYPIEMSAYTQGTSARPIAFKVAALASLIRNSLKSRFGIMGAQ